MLENKYTWWEKRKGDKRSATTRNKWSSMRRQKTLVIIIDFVASFCDYSQIEIE
jgi:hypothetical protein